MNDTLNFDRFVYDVKGVVAEVFEARNRCRADGMDIA
jgi:hypothetical protein